MRDIDLPTSSLELTIVDNQTTTASFTNRSTRGTLRICKVAGTGISAGTMYGFTATKPDHALSLDVPADDCREALVPAGEYALAETVPPDARVTDISCTPLLACCNANVLEGTTTVHVARELLTAVSFTNRSTRGTLRIRKVAGPGVTAGTIYKFGAIKSDHALFIDVPADDCSDAKIPAGESAFSEIIPAGVQVADIGCTPLLACFNVSVPDGTATVHVATDLLTTVTVTNQAVVSGGPDDRP